MSGFLLFSANVYNTCKRIFRLHVLSNFFCIPVFCPRLGLYFIPSPSLHFIICQSVSYCFSHISFYFISAAVIHLASLALTVPFSLPYNKAERACVLYKFTLLFFRFFCGLNILLIMPIIFKQLFNFFNQCPHFFTRYQIS